MDWIQVLTLVGSNFAFILTLWLWNRSEMRADHRNLENNTNSILNGIREDMRDFHATLQRQDAEFRGRMQLQDSEFKSGLLLLEEKFRK